MEQRCCELQSDVTEMRIRPRSKTDGARTQSWRRNGQYTQLNFSLPRPTGRSSDLPVRPPFIWWVPNSGWQVTGSGTIGGTNVPAKWHAEHVRWKRRDHHRQHRWRQVQRFVSAPDGELVSHTSPEIIALLMVVKARSLHHDDVRLTPASHRLIVVDRCATGHRDYFADDLPIEPTMAADVDDRLWSIQGNVDRG